MVKGVCVFDIDKTLTCEFEEEGKCNPSKIDAMRASINLCRERDMGVALNTARTTPNSCSRGQCMPKYDVKHSIPDLVRQLLEDVDVVKTRPLNRPDIEQVKLENMREIAQDFKVKEHETVLIDDKASTIEELKKKDFPVVHVKGNGIDTRELNALRKELDKMHSSRS